MKKEASKDVKSQTVNNETFFFLHIDTVWILFAGLRLSENDGKRERERHRQWQLAADTTAWRSAEPGWLPNRFK